MKKIVTLGLLLAAAPVMAQEADPATVEKVTALLASMQCEVDPANIEAEGDGWELDDVFCADGQYDIKLDANFAVTEKRKE
ncbi:PepSY domain-containing protein [Cereibacter sphaeroides]|uniref:PepSY domain-containing protein n=1 Tax=Cereibacter sphaeroides TaxID=1063 RepID=UPI001F34D5FB|nr:PepSY domain-containing protein [Cereibacter sphaeroides]MCE6953320.1 PepSY domain-containing protein [Cereibacter sphaeroides]MCE6961579.1 PepSY domain-containing protein [Cereibacter sphaeroides]MCE6974929.1 PepSY domain-containing protein [Cereibacter sphaeroides]